MMEEAKANLSVEATSVDSSGLNGFSHNNSEVASGSNIEKIRELLFGVQSREYDRRFARLEETLRHESSSLQEAHRSQFDRLEQVMRQEIGNLITILKAERAERSDADLKLDDKFRQITQTLDARLNQLDAQTSQQERELQQQILSQASTLNDEIQQKYQEILTIVERRTQELRSEKTDRAALASLFRELALRVNSPDVGNS